MKTKCSIRNARAEDMPVVYALIRELAIFEKAEEQLANSVEQLQRDGFGKQPLFWALLAELEGEVLGMSLCYYRYSTWKGKRLYLEDLIVKKQHRGNGIGKSLLDATIERAKNEACTGLMWQVLDWNSPAIDFYRSYGTTLEEHWLNVHLDFERK